MSKLGILEVDKLSYAINNGQRLLYKNLSFRLEAGQSLAITGASGCGKSTLL